MGRMEKIWDRIWRRKKRKGEDEGEDGEGGGGGSDKENETGVGRRANQGDSVGRRGDGEEGIVRGDDQGRSRQGGGNEGAFMRKGQGDEGSFMRSRREEEGEERPQRVVVSATDGKKFFKCHHHNYCFSLGF